MARYTGDELVGDDLDAVLQALDEDFFHEDLQCNEEIDANVGEIPQEVATEQFKCSFCAKTCISQRGLTRHVNSKHPDQSTSTGTIKLLYAEERLHPLHLKKIMLVARDKLAVDECYPQHMMDEFKSMVIETIQDVQPCYDVMKNLISGFNGDVEKFYPKFYKLFIDATKTDNPFNGLSQQSSLIFAFDLANHVVAHLTGLKVVDDAVSVKSDVQFSEKDGTVIFYLSGYVVGTYYKRIRFSKHQGIYHEQCSCFLMACKFKDNEHDVSNHKLVNIKDRGGLWKVNSHTFNIFAAAETFFLKSTEHFTTKIDCKAIVSNMMRDSWILCNFSSIRNKCTEKIKKEVVVSLLEDMLTLYIRVRSHSYAKNKQQLHKIQSGKVKSRSLRTDVKKKSTSLDLGH